MPSRPRFERTKAVGIAAVDFRLGSPGEYLAKLWTLFGAPEIVADGSALYRADESEEALARVIAAFDALLASTSPADCRLEVPIGDGNLVLGARALATGAVSGELDPQVAIQPFVAAGFRAMHFVRVEAQGFALVPVTSVKDVSVGAAVTIGVEW